jgi:shikimate dehydrogenase
MMSFLTGLIGQGIGASLSPRLHEEEARAQGHTLVYRLIETSENDSLKERLSFARTFGFNGVNITHPFKQAIIKHLDDLSPDARAMGAVNTVVFAPNGAIGHNTDWYGFSENLRRRIPDAPLDVVAQVGAGGAGSATAYALLKAGTAELRLHDVDHERAARLADRMKVLFPKQSICALDSITQTLDGSDGVVQATPIGMAAHPGMPFDPGILPPTAWVIDIIYFPSETEFLRAAKARGPAVNGLGMAAFQGALAFELFTGLSADGERILRHLERLT